MRKLLYLVSGAAVALAVALGTSSQANINTSIAGSFPVPTGTMLDYTGTTAPASYRAADGSAVSRTTCAKLFAAVGTTWGAGDGSTTFNLPDFRGRVAAGQDNMGGVAANRITVGNSGITGTTIGAAGGDERRPTHNHGVTDPGHVHTGTVVSSVATWVGTAAAAFGIGNTPSATTGITINNDGLGTAQNVQPTAIVLKIVKADC